MRIVVDAIMLAENNAGERISYLSEVLGHVKQKSLSCTFIILGESKTAHFFDNLTGVEYINVKSRKLNAISLRYWYDVRIPYLLKKYRADLFFSLTGIFSMNTNRPQMILLTELTSTIVQHTTKSHAEFLKKRKDKSAIKATGILTNTDFVKKDLIGKLNLDNEKINILSITANQAYVDTEEKIKGNTKTKYTAGKEFFLYKGAIHSSANLVNLLKAFSLFKKRQQSSLRLVICAEGSTVDKLFLKQIETYKYKADVHIANDLTIAEQAGLVTSAYALIYPSFFSGLMLPVMEAIKCKVPVIASDNPSIRELVGEAALYANPSNPQEIADCMMRIYKDERLRSDLIDKGSSILHHKSFDNSVELVCNIFQKALQ